MGKALGSSPSPSGEKVLKLVGLICIKVIKIHQCLKK